MRITRNPDRIPRLKQIEGYRPIIPIHVVLNVRNLRYINRTRKDLVSHIHRFWLPLSCRTQRILANHEFTRLRYREVGLGSDH